MGDDEVKMKSISRCGSQPRNIVANYTNIHYATVLHAFAS